MSAIQRFHEQFGELFSKRVIEEGDDETPGDYSDSGFIERFGWIYNAKQVADFEGISLDESYEKDVISFFNNLIYLKEYGIYQEKLNKNARDSKW